MNNALLDLLNRHLSNPSADPTNPVFRNRIVDLFLEVLEENDRLAAEVKRLKGTAP